MVGNKKWMIALFSICLVVIAGLLTTVIVLAAPSQTISSNIGISYSVSDIQGSISASYTIGEEGPTSIGTESFTVEQGDQMGSFDPVNINEGLSPTNKSVVFDYVFTSTIKNGYSVTCQYTPTNATNWTVEYSTTNDGSDWQTLSSTCSTTVADGGTAETASTSHLYIRITLKDATVDSTFGGTFNFNLQSTAG